MLAFLRFGLGQQLAVVLNFTPEPRRGYRVGVPEAGRYRVLLNSDSEHYGGTNLGAREIQGENIPAHGLPCSVLLDLPPLAGLILARET